MKHSTTNLGLVISLGGSLLALPFSKKYHVAFGIMLTALASVHSWQHRKSITKYLSNKTIGRGRGLASCTNYPPQKTSISFLDHNMRVMHYLPGRVRLYSRQLLNNLDNADRIKEYLNSVPEIHNFSINPATGSVLLQYSPDDVGCNSFLVDVEKLGVGRYRRN